MLGFSNAQLSKLLKFGESALLFVGGLYELHTGSTDLGIALTGAGAAGLGFTGLLPSTSTSTSPVGSA